MPFLFLCHHILAIKQKFLFRCLSGTELWVFINWNYLKYLCLMFSDASRDFPHSFLSFIFKLKLPEVFLQVRIIRFRFGFGRCGAVRSARDAMMQKYRPADPQTPPEQNLIPHIHLKLQIILSNCKHDPAVDLHRLRPLFKPAALSPSR